MIFLEYFCSIGYKWNLYTCIYAASNGHLDCLKYAHENGCPFLLDINICDSDVNNFIYRDDIFYDNSCLAAAENGHLDCLIYAHESGCPLDENTFKKAAFNGHIDCLKYLYENYRLVAMQIMCHWVNSLGSSSPFFNLNSFVSTLPSGVLIVFVTFRSPLGKR